MATSQLAALEAFLEAHPQITYVTPSSPNYTSLRQIFILDQRANPLAIARPQSASDVSLLVKFATSNNIKFVIRTGGHNLLGYSIEEGALTIDMRDIAYVHIDEGKKTARIGGGILQIGLAAELAKEGLATPTGTIGSVGYVGWAAYGGYGPFAPHFGLGVDQIVGARLVNAAGEVVVADERLLKGIRGAGGLFGVIVEMTIKVYPLKNVLTGMIIYDSQDLDGTFKNYHVGFQKLSAEGLAPELYVQQMVVNSPYGRVICALFTWSSDDVETGRTWLTKIEALGTVVVNTVAVTSIPDWMNATAAMLPASVRGSSRTHNLRQVTSDITDIVVKSFEKMPEDPATMFTIHELRGPSAAPNKESVFGSREPHFMLEILGFATTEENVEKSLSWAEWTWEQLRSIDSGNLLPGTYISVDPPNPGQVPLSKIYGSNAQEVVTLKREYDSGNVFDLAVPRLKDYA